MNFRSFKHFILIFHEFYGEEGLPGHVAHSPSARGRGGLPGMIRGAAGWYPSGLPLGTHVASGDHPGKLARGTWHTRRLPGVHTRWTHGALGGKCLFRKAPGGYVVLVSALGTGGELSGIRKGSPGSGVFGDTWHFPREGPKGQFRKCFRGDSR